MWLYDVMNGGWPQWVGNLANVAQLLGLALPALAFLAGRWSRPRPVVETPEPASLHHPGWRPLCPRRGGSGRGVIAGPTRSGPAAIAGRRARSPRVDAAAPPASPRTAPAAAGPSSPRPAPRRGDRGAVASPACSAGGSPPGRGERGVHSGTDAAPPASSDWPGCSRTCLGRRELPVARDTLARRAGRARLAPAPSSMARPAAYRRTAGRHLAAVDGRSAAGRQGRDWPRGPPGTSRSGAATVGVRSGTASGQVASNSAASPKLLVTISPR
jgi:hypothetical protein